MENGVDKFKKQFEAFESATETARRNSERDRDYADLKQWSDAEKAILKKREQADVVFDYIRESFDYFSGMEIEQRADPKAFPRSRQHEDAADACTDALRYVADNNDFPETASDAFGNLWCEGTEAAIVEVEENRSGTFDVKVRHIPWDRFYYDPHSRKLDFSDAAWKGIVAWLDEPDACKMYPEKAEQIKQACSDAAGGGTFDDKPSWVDKVTKRIRVCQHYYRDSGVWHMCHFSDNLTLVEPEPVKLLDENGDPQCPLEAQSAFIDRENNRYGYVRRLIDPQNEINHRRSKALHMLSSKSVIAEEGVVKDQAEALREMKKADGWVTVRDGALRNGEIQINSNTELSSGQLAMYQDAKDKIAGTGANAAMQGEVSGMSGVAVSKLQAGGKVQVGRVFSSHRAWKKRIYRQCWNRIKQFWDAPMWIRVTDDEQNLKWVGLNQPITVGDELLSAAQAGNREAAAELQAALSAKDVRLLERIQGAEGVRNNVAEIDVDIILDEGPDTLTTAEEQFGLLAELAKVYGPQEVPFKALVELSSMRNKRKVLEMLGGGQDPAMAQAQQMQQQLQQMAMQQQMAEAQARTAKLAAEARKTNAQAEQVEMETQLVATLPDVTPNVNI